MAALLFRLGRGRLFLGGLRHGLRLGIGVRLLQARQIGDERARGLGRDERAPGHRDRRGRALARPRGFEGGLVADAVAIISTVDPIMGEVDR